MATSSIIDRLAAERVADAPRAGGRPFVLAAGAPLGALVSLAVVQAAGGGRGWLFSWPLPLLAALAVLLCSRAAGATLTRAILGGPAVPRHAALPVGLAAFAAASLGLGLVGLLSPASLGLVCLAGVLPAAARLVARARRRGLARTTTDALDDADAALRRLVARPDAWLPLAPFGLFFAWASLPPTLYDAVVYHLGLPNLYLNAGGLVWPARFSIAAYPQYAEMVNLYPLALGGETAVALCGFLVAAAAALSLRSLLEERFGRWPAALGTLFVVSQWPFWFQAAFLKNDLFAAFLLLAGIRLRLADGDAGASRRTALAGALAGVAVGAKWLAGLPAVLVALALAPRGGRGFRHVALFLAACGLLAAPWLARNAAHHGNPVFPALYATLGGTDWSDASAERMAAATGTEMPRDPASVVRRLVGVGWTKGHGSGGEASWLLLPTLLVGLAAAPAGGDRRMLAVALLTLGLGVGLVSSYLRLFFLALLLSGVAVAVLAWRPPRRAARLAAAALVLVACAEGLASSVKMCERLTDGGSAVVLGARPVDAHLDRLVNYAPLARRMEARLAPEARLIVVGSARTAYLPRRADATYAWDAPLIADAFRRDAENDAVTAALLRAGFTHVLFNGFDLVQAERSDGRFGLRDAPEVADRLNGWLASLTLLDRENEAYLFALPATDEVARSR